MKTKLTIGLTALVIGSSVVASCEGPTGPQGDEGPVGPAGADGSVIHSGQGAPDDGLGSTGDFYVDLSTGELYGPKAGGGWGGATFNLSGPRGPAGPPGEDGRDGSRISVGEGAPDDGLGAAGDFYLDVASYGLYGPKAVNVENPWGNPIDLQRPVIYSEWLGDVSFEIGTEIFNSNLITADLPASELTQKIIDEGGIFVYIRAPFAGDLDTFLLTPFAFDFGEVPVGETSPPQSVEVTNVSVVSQTLSLAGGAAGVFGGSTNCQGITLAPGESCQITYRFEPTEEGDTSRSTSVTINGRSFGFDFRGIGIADAGDATEAFLITPTSLDFGDVPVGETSPPQSVAVINVSAVSQTPSLAGGAAGVFGGSTNCQGITLAPAESCQITYRFEPTVEGDTSRSTNVSVNGQPQSFDFRGTGIPTGERFVQQLPSDHFFGDDLYTLDFYANQPFHITLTLLAHDNVPDLDDVPPALTANSQFRYVLVPPGVPALAAMSANGWSDYDAVAEYYGIPDH